MVPSEVLSPLTGLRQALPGTVIGGSGAMIYIIDQSSQQLSGLTVDQKGKLEAVKPLDLQRAFTDAAAAGTGKKPKKYGASRRCVNDDTVHERENEAQHG